MAIHERDLFDTSTDHIAYLDPHDADAFTPGCPECEARERSGPSRSNSGLRSVISGSPAGRRRRRPHRCRSERSDMWAHHGRLLEHGRRPITTARVVAQVSRNHRQVILHRLLGRLPDHRIRRRRRATGRGPARTLEHLRQHLVCVAERHRALVLTSDGDNIAHVADHVETSLRHRRL